MKSGARITFTAALIAMGLLAAGAREAAAAVPVEQRDALIALHNQTNGSAWTHRDNWLGAEGTECTWYGVTCNADQTAVLQLDLARNLLSGVLPVELGQLTALETLRLADNQLAGAIPSELGELASLGTLDLGQNRLVGEIPASLGDLSNLTYVDLAHNALTGAIPSSMGRLGQLQFLALNSNQLTGEIPAVLGDLAQLWHINLGSNQLAGAIPSSFGSLSRLRFLFLRENELTGPIPSSLVNLSALDTLSLGLNQLTGGIPAGLGSLPFLVTLSAPSNRLTGPIPATLGGLSRLFWHLNLSGNQLTGEIPSSLGGLSELRTLDLSSNGLTGPIPAGLGNLTHLSSLVLSYNRLSGPIPRGLGALPALVTLNLASNDLTGAIPASLGGLGALEALDLRQNALTGTIPAGLGSLARLTKLYLSENRLEGTIPPALGSLARLETLDFTGNQLVGEIPASLGDLAALTSLGLAANRLSGEIPTSLCTLSALGSLELHYNVLTGTIPACLGDLANLTLLRLAGNSLTGAIPASLGSLGNLLELSLYWNQLTGVIPAELGHLSRIESLNLSVNRLTGTIPAELGNLASLRRLYLDANQLTGAIPLSLTRLGQLEDLYLGLNQLTGGIPSELGNVTTLRALSLSRNQLTGPIPPSLGRLTALWALLLDENHLTGAIPPELGGLTRLVTLLLGSNQLTGSIPPVLGNLSALQALDLRSNAFGGPIPAGMAGLSNLTFLDIRWNALYASEPALVTFLDARQPGWRNTQTVAPRQLTVVGATATAVTLVWLPITYTTDGGGYRVCYAPVVGGGEAICQAGTTPSKRATQAVVMGLAPATAYSFFVLTETAPHADNVNRVVSNPSTLIVGASTGPVPIRFGAVTFAANERETAATITVTRSSGGADGVLVDYATANGTAEEPGDYVQTSGTLTFAAGQLQRTFAVPMAQDTAAEGKETVQLMLTNARAGGILGTPSTATLTITDDDVAGAFQFGSAAFGVTEAGGTATVTVKRAGGTASDALVDYATSNGTATAGLDYEGTGGTLSFGAGQRTATFSVRILDDVLGEKNETVALTLSNPRGWATLGAQKTAVLTILEDERVVELAAVKQSIAEAGVQATVTVQRSGFLQGAVSVEYVTSDGTAKAGVDYQARAGTLTFGANVTSASFVVKVMNDTLDETDESFVVRLRNPAGGVLGAREAALVTVVDDDTAGLVQLSTAAYAVAENKGSAQVTLTRTGGVAGGVVVSYAATAGTAEAPGDFTAVSGALTFVAGQLSTSFAVPIQNDTEPEGVETVALALTGVTGGARLGRSSAVLTIGDDESAIELGATAYNVVEGGTVTLVVRRSGALTGVVTVPFETLPGTALAPQDFTSRTGTLTFGAGVASQPIAVVTTADTLNEAEKAFTVSLGTAVGAPLGRARRAEVTIRDNDPAGVVQLSAPAYAVQETGVLATITVNRTGGTASGVTVAYGTSDGSATAGSDYRTSTGTLSFAVNQAAATFTVPIEDDTEGEGSETVNVMLGTPTGGAGMGAMSRAVLTILDNDGTRVQVGPLAQSVAESGVATLTIARKGVTTGVSTVAWSTVSGTATGEDYGARSGTATFAAGQVSQSVSVSITRDERQEGSESFEVRLESPTGATLGASVATVTIVDDDVAGKAQLEPAVLSRVEPTVGTSSLAAVTVTRTGGVAAEALVDYQASDGTASAGADYASSSGTLTFAAGQTSATFEVRLLGDSELEGNETVVLTLSNPRGGLSLGAPSAGTLWIVEPAGAVKLIFVHHSTGEGWLADAHGQLGKTLRENNYFVSDTSYSWGPPYAEGTGTIGDHTDIGHWWDWFRGANSGVYLEALYQEYGALSAYTRLADPDERRENEIVLIKSCFPNSALAGNPTDAATVGVNPLRSQDASSEAMTVAHAKGIYNDLLEYFSAHPEKLFVVVTAPPLVAGTTNAEQAANARGLNDWLVSEWLSGYAGRNVAVLDFFTVLTSNGGSAAVHDLGKATGNHHRWWNGAVEHVKGVASDVAAYGTSASDSHPTPAGGRKATGELVTLLNFYYNRWRGFATPLGATASGTVALGATATGEQASAATKAPATPVFGPDAIAPPGFVAER